MVARRIRVGTASSYQGVGDAKSGAVAYYGLRAYDAAKAATAPFPGIQVVDQATGLITNDINILTTGALDLATLAGLGSVWISKIYDQVGTNYLFSNSDGTSPTVNATATPNSKPGMVFTSAGGTILQSHVTPGLTAPFTFGVFAERNANTTTVGSIISELSHNLQILRFNSNVNEVLTYDAAAGIITATASDSGFHSMQAVIDSGGGATSSIYVDGSASSDVGNTLGSGVAISNAIRVGANSGLSLGSFDGFFCEMGVWSSKLSSGDCSAISSNQHTYWG